MDYKIKLGEVFLYKDERKLGFSCFKCGLEAGLIVDFLMHSMKHQGEVVSCDELNKLLKLMGDGDTQDASKKLEDPLSERIQALEVESHNPEDDPLKDSFGKGCDKEYDSSPESEMDDGFGVAERLAATTLPVLWVLDSIVEDYPVHRRQKFKCELCGSNFRNFKNLQTHLMVEHKTSSPYVCEICGASFTDISNCRNHKRRHDGVKKHACSLDGCGKSFFSATDLKTHIRSHTGEKPFKCETCETPFKCRSTLAVHRRRHRNERSHICAHCGKTFFSIQTLRAHENTHSQEKLFACPTCSAPFKCKNSLRQHIKLHSEKKYTCEVCGKKFAQGPGLYSHRKSHKKYNSDGKNKKGGNPELIEPPCGATMHA